MAKSKKGISNKGKRKSNKRLNKKRVMPNVLPKETVPPSGRMMFQMVGVFSEFERSMISERVKLGLKRVKSKGTKLGRPNKIDDLTKEQDPSW